jgi:hypothetical protein
VTRHVYYVRWGRGALRLAVSSDVLEVTAANANIVFELRSVIVEAKYTYKKDVEGANKRNLYIGFAEEIKPLEAPRVDIASRNYIGYFEVIYTDLEFERYLTVITPASFLYDYVVLTSSELMLQMSPRRKVYFEEEPYDKLIVYIT